MRQIEFQAIDPADSSRTSLPDVEKWDLSPARGGKGTVVITYPVTGRGFDKLFEHVTQDRDLFLAVRVDGVERPELTTIISDTQGDLVDPAAVWTFTGRFQIQILDEAIVEPEPDAQGVLRDASFTAASPGTIISTLVLRAVTRGALAGVTTGTFDSATDSNGVPWAKVATLGIPAGNTILDVLLLGFDQGLFEWDLVGLDLRLYNPGTLGVDRTIPQPPMVFHAGRDMIDSPFTHSVLEAGTALYLAGKDALGISISDPTAESRRGRRIEKYASDSTIEDAGTLAASAEARLAKSVDGTREQSHGLNFYDGSPVPLTDFDLYDWVFSDTGRGFERLQVAQWTVSQDANKELTGSVVLNDLVDTRAVQLQRRIDQISGGQIVIGTSPPPSQEADTVPPAQPHGLVASSSAYTTSTGLTQAQVTASWAAVTINADGTAIDDLDGYEVFWKYADPGLDPNEQYGGSTTSTQLSWSGMSPGVTVSWRVRAVDRAGNRSTFSAYNSLTTGADVTPPPRPSTPVVDSYLGILTVTWDGIGSLGESQPPDYVETEVHVSNVSGFAPSAATRIGVLRAAGTFPWADGSYGVTYYAKLVSYDTSGNPSNPSAEGSATLVRAADGDIGSVSIGKLTAGIMSALMTVSGIIQTANTGARVVLDAAGLRCYSSTNALLFEFNIPASRLTLVGKLISGIGVGVGRTVVVDPAVPEIAFYPDATLRRVRLSAFVGGSGSVLRADMRNPAGAADGGFVQWQTDGVWMGIDDGTGVGGYAQTLKTYGEFGMAQAAGNSRIRFDNDGIGLVARTNQTITANQPMGDQGSGFSFRAQGGNNQGYRTYTGGGAYLGFVENQSNALVNLGGPSGAYKTFVIDHPTDDERYLVHVCTESPRAGVEYWGEAVIHNGLAAVDLPLYFDALTDPADRQAQVTAVCDEAVGYRPFLAGAGPVGAKGFFIYAPDAPDGARVSWLVKATRVGPAFDVEPLRSDVAVQGFGPYRTTIPVSDLPPPPLPAERNTYEEHA